MSNDHQDGDVLEAGIRAALATTERNAPRPPGLVDRLIDQATRPQISADRPPAWGPRRWLLTAAAVCTVAAVAALTAVLGTGSGHHGAADRGGQSPATTSTLRSTPPTASGVPTAWSFTRRGTSQPSALVASDGVLIAVHTDADTSTAQLQRLDPADGAVTSTASYPTGRSRLLPGQGLPVIAGGHVWAATARASGSSVRWYSASSLQLQGHRSLPAASSSVVAALTASPDGSTVYVGIGNTIWPIEAGAGRVGTRITLQPAQRITALAMSSDGARLYVAANAGTEPDSTLTVLRTTDHSVLARLGGTPGVGETATITGTINGLTASEGGLWISSFAGANGQEVQYLPANLNPRELRSPAVDIGGGGTTVVATVAGGSLWLGGGPHGLACLDPRSGATLSSTALHDGVQVSQVVDTGNKLFAVESTGNGHTLVQLTAPAACTRR